MSKTSGNIGNFVQWIRSQGISCEDLDEIIHELNSSCASSINNGGMRAQAEYILDSFSNEEKSKNYLRKFFYIAHDAPVPDGPMISVDVVVRVIMRLPKNTPPERYESMVDEVVNSIDYDMGEDKSIIVDTGTRVDIVETEIVDTGADTLRLS